MKIKEYDQMMNYLTRPGKVLANNINNKKIPNTDARTSLKRGGSDTKVAPKKAKILQYINDHNIVYGDKKATKEEIEASAKRIDSTKVAKKIPVIPPKPDMVNGHSDWTTDDWLETIDQGGWVDDRRRTGILEQDLANEYWQTQYENYQNNGGTLSYPQYMQQQLNNKVSREINKRVKDKMQTEGIAQILGVDSGRKI